MVLVNARLDLPGPDISTAKFVDVASLVHEYITSPQGVARDLRSLHSNRLDLCEIQVPILDIRHTEICHFARIREEAVRVLRDPTTNRRRPTSKAITQPL